MTHWQLAGLNLRLEVLLLPKNHLREPVLPQAQESRALLHHSAEGKVVLFLIPLLPCSSTVNVELALPAELEMASRGWVHWSHGPS